MYTEYAHYMLMLAAFIAFNFKRPISVLWIIAFYCVVLTMCFFNAMVCYMFSDFSIYNILTNSNANTPLLFQLSATWSNHEGSLLLWCWLLCIYGFIFCYLIQPWKSALEYIPIDHTLKNDKKHTAIASGGINGSCLYKETCADRKKYKEYKNDLIGTSIECSSTQWSNLPWRLCAVIQQRLRGVLQRSPLVPPPSFGYAKQKWLVLLGKPFASSKQRFPDACSVPSKHTLFEHRAFTTLSQIQSLPALYSSPIRLMKWLATFISSHFDLLTTFDKMFKTKLLLGKVEHSGVVCYHAPYRIDNFGCSSSILRSFRIYIYVWMFFVVFLLMTSNPFIRIPFICLNSVAELNPVLQDPILAIHPPCIYAGYVASAVGFSICLSKWMQANAMGMMTSKCATHLEQLAGQTMSHCFSGKNKTALLHWNAFSLTENKALLAFCVFCSNTHCDKTARCVATLPFMPNRYWPQMWTQIRVWCLLCWCFLTVGILLGSWWAYHELGWGGWWFWDPVENASLMPWLIVTACVHSVLTPRLNGWTLCLTALTFVLSILGTFFVRSGVLASVHSFATDSTRGLFILCFVLSIVAISALYYGKYSTNRSSHQKRQVYAIKRAQLQAIKRMLKTIYLSPTIGNLSLLTSPPNTIPGTLKYTLGVDTQYQHQSLDALVPRSLSFTTCGVSHHTYYTYRSHKVRYTMKENRFTSCACGKRCLITLARIGAWNQYDKSLCLLRSNAYATIIAFGTTRRDGVPVASVTAYCGYLYTNTASPENVCCYATHTGKPVTNGEPSISRSQIKVEVRRSRKAPMCGAAPHTLPFGNACCVATHTPRTNRTTSVDTQYQGSCVLQSNTHSSRNLYFATRNRSGSFYSPVAFGNAHRWCRTFLLKVIPPLLYAKTRVEQLLQLQNGVLLTICAVVMCGTAAPIVFQALYNRDVSIGAPFFNGLIVPLFAGLLLVLIYLHCAQLRVQNISFSLHSKLERLGWSVCCYTTHIGALRLRRPSTSRLFFLNPILYCSIPLLVFHFGLFMQLASFSAAESLYALSVFLLFCSVLLSPQMKLSIKSELFTHKSLPSRLVPLTKRFQRLAINMKIPHVSAGMFTIGILLSNRNKTQFTEIMHPGNEVRLANQFGCLRSIDHNYGPTFRSICGNVIIYQPNKHFKILPSLKSNNTAMHNISNRPLKDSRIMIEWLQFDDELKQNQGQISHSMCLFPEKRFFISNEELSTTKVAIHTNLFSDFYALIGSGSAETGWFITIMHLPYIVCIWLGFVFAAIGGCSSLRTVCQKRPLHWQ